MMTLSPFMNVFLPLLIFNGVFLFLLIIFVIISKNRPKSDFVENRHSSVILNKYLREYWVWITNPIVQFFIRNKVSPNTISLIGTFLGIVASFFFAKGFLALASWTMIAGASFDIFDGRVARETNHMTESGAYLDSVLDRISESAIFTGLAYFYCHSFIFWFVMAAYLGAMMTSYAKCKGNSQGVNYEGGMMQRPERIVYIGVSGIFTPVVAYLLHQLPVFQQYDLMQFTYLIYGVPLAFVGVMSNVTSYNRIIHNMRLLDEKSK